MQNQDVLLFVDNIFRFTQAGSEVSTQALAEFKKVFRTSEGLLLGREEHTPMDEAEIGQETIVRKKRS